MALAGTIYGQAPTPNPLGAALISSAQNLGNAQVEGQKIKRQQDEQLVTLTMNFLPKLANNPDLMQQFTSHPDFGRVLGAFNRVGLGSVFPRDPKTGGYSVAIPPDTLSLDQMVGQDIQSLHPGNDPTARQARIDAATNYKKFESPLTQVLKGAQAGAADASADNSAANAEKNKEEAEKLRLKNQQEQEDIARNKLRNTPYSGKEKKLAFDITDFKGIPFIKRVPKYRNEAEALRARLQQGQ